jgi:hypothetical protein
MPGFASSHPDIVVTVCLAPRCPTSEHVRTHLKKRHPRTQTTPACVRASPSVAYLIRTPIPPPCCHLRRAPSGNAPAAPLHRPCHAVQCHAPFAGPCVQRHIPSLPRCLLRVPGRVLLRRGPHQVPWRPCLPATRDIAICATHKIYF